MNPSVLLCDYDRTLSVILADYLRDKGFDVTLLHDGQEAQDALLKIPFDCCILDSQRIRPTGYSILSAIRSAERQVPVIMLGETHHREEVIRAYTLGADDYITKPFSMDILICKMHALIRRFRVFQTSTQTEFLLGTKCFDSVHQTIDGKHISSRESDLLLMLCRNMNRLVDRHDILRSLWQQDDYFASRSLAVYINHLRTYLQGTELQIMSVHGKGYKLCD